MESQFYLPPTREPYLPLLHSRKESLPFELAWVAGYIPRLISRTGNWTRISYGHPSKY